MASERPVLEARSRLDGFNADRERVLREVERRVVERIAARAAGGGDASLEYVVNDVCVNEIKRLEAGRKDAGRWRELAGRLGAMSAAELTGELRRLVGHYGRDIVGNFDPRVYRFATKVLTPGLGFLFAPMQSVRGGVGGLLAELDSRIQVEGPLELLRAMAERGTLVVTPTHSSNMDSVVIGLALERAGLPPVTYGAGKNLFTNPFISFFMHNLGAYRVDRRLRFELYKEILKEYSTVLLESGYHSLFFPGGTRCRSNVIEPSVKLGLLGTAVTAYGNLAAGGGAHKRIYVVPVTINYRLVLEAETLIEDYLAETGKSRYIITDDEFSRLGRIVEFLRKILVHEGAVVIRFGRPLDPLGHDVDDDGRSLDRSGRPVDLRSYFVGADGGYRADDQRDAEYTRLLGRRLVAAYPRESVFHATTVVARAVYDRLCVSAGTRDIYRLTRLPPGREVAVADVVRGLGDLRRALAARPEAGRLHHRVASAGDSAALDDAVRALGSYHAHPVLERRGDHLRIGDVKLLYYYQNRLAHLPVEVRVTRGAVTRGAVTRGAVTRGDTVGIVGAGTFGTALAVALARAGRSVVLYTRTPAIAAAIATTRRCPRLPDVDVPAAVRVVSDARELAAAARFLVVAVTSTDVGARLIELGAVVDGGHLIVHAIGALAAPDDVRVSELIERTTPVLRAGVLAGPALPRDLAGGRFASMVVASAFDEVVAEARRLLNLPPALRLYGSRDVVGVELASALAGAYTAALGLADGAKVGVGPRAVLITRACAEAARLIEAAGGAARTFAGLAGLGNLLVRAATDDDPDYALGRALARGVPLPARTTEGARAAMTALRLAERKRVRMPLLDGLAAVLAGRKSVADAIHLADTVAAEE